MAQLPIAVRILINDCLCNLLYSAVGSPAMDRKIPTATVCTSTSNFGKVGCIWFCICTSRRSI